MPTTSKQSLVRRLGLPFPVHATLKSHAYEYAPSETNSEGIQRGNSPFQQGRGCAVSQKVNPPNPGALADVDCRES